MLQGFAWPWIGRLPATPYELDNVQSDFGVMAWQARNELQCPMAVECTSEYKCKTDESCQHTFFTINKTHRCNSTIRNSISRTINMSPGFIPDYVVNYSVFRKLDNPNIIWTFCVPQTFRTIEQHPYY